MAQNITSKYPLLFPTEKVFVERDKIIFFKDKDSKEIYFKNITSIDINSFIYNLWLSYKKMNDLVITTNTGDKFKLYNITVSGTEELLNKLKLFNPNVTINKASKSAFNIHIICSLFRTRFTVPSIIAFAIVILFSLIAILIINLQIDFESAL